MKNKDIKENKEIEGFDLVDNTPDYNKTVEENNKIYREKYKKVYGKYPEEIEE
jgi:hypothetical protein